MTRTVSPAGILLGPELVAVLVPGMIISGRWRKVYLIVHTANFHATVSSEKHSVMLMLC